MPRSLRSILSLSCLLAVALLSGCASTPGRTTSNDPWQGMNRGIYKLNDVADRAAVKPLAKGYRKITPSWMRTGISNFFTNIGTPWVMVNELLQGKPGAMAQDTCRLVLNTIVGLGGFIDVASKLEMEVHDEDFGQTLAVWGVPSGPYLVLPAFGPSTLRDGFGRIPDWFGRPLRYADIPWETSTGLTTLDVVQTREGLLSVEDTLNQAYDPYGVMRDAWLQRREYLIYDGNPPEPALEEDMPEDEDVAADNATDAAAPATP
ncbi:MAG: VacJ family lipoprotein [Steroidobacteraceae bacterium]